MQNVSSLMAHGVGYVMCGDDFCDLPIVEHSNMEGTAYEYGNDAVEHLLMPYDAIGYRLIVADVSDGWSFSDLGCEVVANDGKVIGWVVHTLLGYYCWANTE